MPEEGDGAGPVQHEIGRPSLRRVSDERDQFHVDLKRYGPDDPPYRTKRLAGSYEAWHDTIGEKGTEIYPE